MSRIMLQNYLLNIGIMLQKLDFLPEFCYTIIEVIVVLYRKAYDDLIKWKAQPNKKALLITGARQIGKTFIVREFGRNNYDNFVEINFITNPDAARIFSGDLNADTLIINLTAYTQRSLQQGKTLIFFDEIQECPEARTAIKFLVDDGRFDYIESGSLLGVNYKTVKSFPVGYEEVYRMFPLDFEEFAVANGLQPETVSYLKACYDEAKPVSEAVHQSMLKLFYYYTIIGGMPAAVQAFVDTQDVAEVLRIQNDIVALYRQDITKYSTANREKIKNIFDMIPAELNDKNRRFMLTDIKSSARMLRYETSFNWLSDAGVALPCYNITEPKLPLELNTQNNLFKLFLCDTGLLCAMSLGNIQFDILQGDLSVNLGSILENMFAQIFTANHFALRYFNKKKIGEVDFIIQQGRSVVPVEIKSGSDYTIHKALDNLLEVDEWKLQRAIVFCKGNVAVEGKITYYPWYMSMFFQQSTLPKTLKVDVNVVNIDNFK